jgi:hypothetical protein
MMMSDREHGVIQPRVLSREAAAKYCVCETTSAFDDWVRKGIVPKAIPGTSKWDKLAIDDYLDRFRSLASIVQAVSPLDEWMAQQRGS